MGVSIGICVIKEPDEKFKLMREIWHNCEKLNISIPKEVDDYFNGYEPKDEGVALHTDDLEKLGIIERGNNVYDEYKINIKNLLSSHGDATHIIVSLDY